MSNRHVRKIRNAMHRLEWAATRGSGVVSVEDVRAERRIVEAELDALEGLLEDPRPRELCPGSRAGSEHEFVSDADGGHCGVCGHGHT